MWIRLLKPHAVFYPGTVEAQGSTHSIGNPHGQELIRQGIAEAVTGPLCVAAEPSATTPTPTDRPDRAYDRVSVTSRAAKRARAKAALAGVAKHAVSSKAQQALAGALAKARTAT